MPWVARFASDEPRKWHTYALIPIQRSYDADSTARIAILRARVALDTERVQLRNVYWSEYGVWQ